MSRQRTPDTVAVEHAACVVGLLLFLVLIPYSGAVASAIVIVPTAPVPSTDVSLSVSAEAGPVGEDDLITYDLSVSNLGPVEATNVATKIDLPGRTKKADVSVISVSTDQGTCSVPDGRLKLICSLGSVGSGADVEMGIVVQVTDLAKGTLRASASVDASERDPDRRNNMVRTETTIQ